MSQALHELILAEGSDREIERAARENGMNTLLETGIAKCLAGETSLEEVLRVTSAC
jgi:type II secretory ATPase GspE/PulE/Tfp pilus assembly ATPase PilB-like protein